MNKGKLKWTWVIFPFILIACVVVYAWRDDKLDSAMCELAGPDAVDCGRSPKPMDWKQYRKVQGCTVEAFKAKRPFRARDDETAEPSSSTAIIGTGDGKIYHLIQRRPAWFLPFRVEMLQGSEPKVVTLPGGLQRIRTKKPMPVAN